MTAPALDIALAELEQKVLICSEVIVEEGIVLHERTHKFTVDFIMRHCPVLSPPPMRSKRRSG